MMLSVWTVFFSGEKIWLKKFDRSMEKMRVFKEMKNFDWLNLNSEKWIWLINVAPGDRLYAGAIAEGLLLYNT